MCLIYTFTFGIPTVSLIKETFGINAYTDTFYIKKKCVMVISLSYLERNPSNSFYDLQHFVSLPLYVEISNVLHNFNYGYVHW